VSGKAAESFADYVRRTGLAAEFAARRQARERSSLQDVCSWRRTWPTLLPRFKPPANVYSDHFSAN
jgi:hypothetical protein